MKKIALMATLVLTALCLAGCGTQVEEAINKETSIFVRIETTGHWEVVYDKETKVMYAVSYGVHSSGTFTLLVNADGTPKLWKGDGK